MKKIITILLFVFFYQGYGQDKDEQVLKMLEKMEEIEKENQSKIQDAVDKEFVASQTIPFGVLIVAGGNEYKVLLILHETSNDNYTVLIYANSIDHMKLSINEVLSLDSFESLEFGDLHIQRNDDNLKFDFNYRVGVKYLNELYNKL
ncbi:hypothetical protein [Ekhidna sp.]